MIEVLSVLDLVGTFVFAISGALAGVQKKLDIFGVSVLAFATGTVGGISRDVLIGATPPLAITHQRYVLATLVAAIAVFFAHRFFAKIERPIAHFDAAGLAMFAVAGSLRALEFGINPFMAALFGVLTGIGGGVCRDLLVNRVPLVFQRDELYATAAFAGAAVAVVGYELSWPVSLTAVSGAVICFLVRVLAMRFGWYLPTPKH